MRRWLGRFDKNSKRGMCLPIFMGERSISIAFTRRCSRKGHPSVKIRDLIGLRILVKTEADCYIALGALHHKWNYHPDRLRDWIGQPKKNGYQSLHTTILDDGKPVEIQGRTYQMHKIAEDGIAAHWSYKEGIPTNQTGTFHFRKL